MGVIATLLLILLGASWPSYFFSTAALLALPSPFLFGALIIFPQLIGRCPRLRFCLYFCVGVSILCYAFEWLWLKFTLSVV
jgi:hypothetical protein